MKFEYFDKAREASREIIAGILSDKSYTKGNAYLGFINEILEEFRKKKIYTEIRDASLGKSTVNQRLKETWFKRRIPLLKQKQIGRLQYIANHEFGELSYIFSFLAYLAKNINPPQLKLKLNISKISLSDVYGEVFASTVSPLTIEEQLKFIQHIKKGEIFNYSFFFPIKNFLFNYSYLSTQGTFLNLRKKDENYKYRNISDILEEILSYQKGFNREKRDNFQLKFFDSSMESMKSTLLDMGKKRVTEAIYNKNPSDLGLIVFNYERIKSNLEKKL